MTYLYSKCIIPGQENSLSVSTHPSATSLESGVEMGRRLQRQEQRTPHKVWDLYQARLQETSTLAPCHAIPQLSREHHTRKCQ